MSERETTAIPPAEDVSADALRDIPRDLRLALMIWWRAHHHGGLQEQIEAEATLCAAINPRIAGFRELEHGKR